MSTATATISNANTPGFPVGTFVDHVVCSLLSQTGNPVNNQSQNIPAPTGASSQAVFGSVSPDTYKVSCQGMDGNGNPLGSPAVSTAFTVAAPPPTISLILPSSVSVAVS